MHDYKSINFSSKKNLVAEKRFELLTLRVWTECSSQLSYSAMIQRNQVRELMFSLDWLHFYINTFLRICQYKINKFLNLNKNGDPTGIRTRVTAVKGRCLEPLDHRAILYVLFIYILNCVLSRLRRGLLLTFSHGKWNETGIWPSWHS